MELYASKAIPRAGKEEDILAWWYKNSQALPILSTLAKTVLAIPASASKSERVFSRGGLIVTPKRQRLGADILEDLVIITLNTEFLDADDC